MEWPEARARLAAPIFAPLQPILSQLPGERWPTLDELSALAANVRTAMDRPVRFVAPDRMAGDRLTYERHIAMTGEVPSRPRNWHDLFNALCWITWPLTKAKINAQHVALLDERGDAELRQRGPERDSLTLFDEGGVIVAASDPALLQLVRDFCWKELFWERRAEAEARLRFFVFGHGCYEQALAPYLGMVAKTVFVPVDELFHLLPIEVQLPRVDALAAAFFASRIRFSSPKSLAPMPILGVPGWHFGEQDEAFYSDAKHFRSKPR